MFFIDEGWDCVDWELGGLLALVFLVLDVRTSGVWRFEIWEWDGLYQPVRVSRRHGMEGGSRYQKCAECQHRSRGGPTFHHNLDVIPVTPLHMYALQILLAQNIPSGRKHPKRIE